MALDTEYRERTDEAQISEREARAANLFDIRRIIGGLFLVYGAVLIVLGSGVSASDLRRASGMNVNLDVGIGLVIVAGLFIAWAVIRPLSREIGAGSRVGSRHGDAPAREEEEEPRFSREPAPERRRAHAGHAR
jgi:hypothetical protein